MFLVDKYSPQIIDPKSYEYKLDKLSYINSDSKKIKGVYFHNEIIARLLRMSCDDSIPNIMFCGPKGSGKKTLVKLFLEMIYGSDINNLENATYTVRGSSSKETEIIVKQSNHHIIINPNNSNSDRYLVQDVIKSYARKKSLDIFKTKKSFKTILINNVDNLTYYAQTSLRRTMEIYSKNCRFILWCSSSSQVIDPLISRCVFLTIPSPSDNHLFSFLLTVSIKENMILKYQQYKKIIKNANGNIKTVLWQLEMFKHNVTEDFSYETTIQSIVDLILTTDISNFGSKDDGLLSYIYCIMMTNINGTKIIKDLLFDLCERNLEDNIILKIICAASKYEHTYTQGRHTIMHIKSFVITVMNIIADKNI